MTRWTRLLIPLLILLSLTAQALAKDPADKPIQVFVSVLPMKYLVERVGGSHVNARAMVGPGQSPHTYEPTPRQMTELSRAQIYYRIGVSFEQIWMKRIAALNPSLRIIDLRDGIRLRKLEDHHDEEGHNKTGHAEGAYDANLDPHLWTSPVLARTMADHIRATLAERDPAHAQDYQAGFDSVAADLTALDTRLRNRLDRVTHRKFLVFHPSWGYFADTYGLQQLAIEASGKEPGPRSLANIIALARQENIRVIFVQPQFSRTTANTVARAIGGKVIPIDPLAENYIDNLHKAADAFLTSLEN